MTRLPSKITVGTYTFVCAAPVFSPVPGEYGGSFPFQVDMTSVTPNAEMYYTLDDTEPSEASIPYSGPIELSGDTIIKAKAYYEQWTPSTTTSGSYTFV